MDNFTFKESDLYSIGGLIAVVPMIALGLAKLFGPFSPRLGHSIVIGLTFLIGFAVKLTVKVSFPGFGWVGLVVGLLIAALIAAQAYDTGAHLLGASGAPKASDQQIAGPPTGPQNPGGSP